MSPLVRKGSIRVRDMGERVALLDEVTGQVHLLDSVASALWRRADGTATPEQLITTVSEERQLTIEDVKRGLADLQDAGLFLTAADAPGLRRRSVLTAAALVPTVLTIGAASASAAPVELVTLCHRGRTIRVHPGAVDDHLKHGDTVGPCGSTTTTTLAPEPTTTTTLPPQPTTTTLAPPPTTTMAPPPTTTTLAPPPTTTMAPPPTTTMAPPPTTTMAPPPTTTMAP